MLLFQNPGAIDLDAALIMGVNAKISKSPIGYFGSGLKFAIAVLLRTGHKVVICRGTEPFHFTTNPITTRGKSFDQVFCNDKPLGFTTELGKNWEVWEAFRELYCNAKDEGGMTDFMHAGDLDSIVLLPNTTSIVVIGPGIEDAWNKRGEFLFLEKPDMVIDNLCEIVKRPSNFIFYRGIRVKKMDSSWPFTVNFTQSMTLTENRTLQWDWQYNEAFSKIGDHLAQIGEVDMCKSLLLPESSTSPTHGIYWGGVLNDQAMSKEWVDIVRAISKTNLTALTQRAQVAFGKHTTKEDLDVQPFLLNSIQQAQFERAMRFCHAMGFPADEYPIIFAQRLGGGILGLAKNDKIYVAMDAFEYGTKQVAATLAEEFIHLRYKHNDESRGMQNFLFNRLLSVVEEQMGEAL